MSSEDTNTETCEHCTETEAECNCLLCDHCGCKLDDCECEMCYYCENVVNECCCSFCGHCGERLNSDECCDYCSGGDTCDDNNIYEYDYDPMETLDFQRLNTENPLVKDVVVNESGDTEKEDITPYLGVEIEVEQRMDCPSDITGLVLKELNIDEARGRAIAVAVKADKFDSDHDNKDYAILKHDGSLCEGGFEIVTAPCTLAYHKTKWKDFCADSGAQQHLKSWNTGTCGMHVHITRRAFSPLQLGMMLTFYSCKENKEFIEHIAGRGDVQYVRWINGKEPRDILEDDEYRTNKYGNYQMLRDSDRYTNVNLSNANTVEIRIFRGNINRKAIMRNLEFVHAVFMYCKDAGMTNLYYEDFTHWVYKNGEQYHYLKEWLTSNGYFASVISCKRMNKKLNKLRNNKKDIK